MHKFIIQYFCCFSFSSFFNLNDRKKAYPIKVLVAKYKGNWKYEKSKNRLLLVTMYEEGELISRHDAFLRKFISAYHEKREIVSP